MRLKLSKQINGFTNKAAARLNLHPLPTRRYFNLTSEYG